MDPAKLRLFAGISGALFGFAGIVAMLVAGAIAIAPHVGTATSALIAGLAFVMLGCSLMALFLKPMTSSAEEFDQIEDAAADALADLPIDAIKVMIEKRPLVATAIAGVIGYNLLQDPENTGRALQRTVLGLL